MIKRTWYSGKNKFPQCFFFSAQMLDSEVKCLTGNPRSLGFKPCLILWAFHLTVLWQDVSEPQPSTGETKERHVVERGVDSILSVQSISLLKAW